LEEDNPGRWLELIENEALPALRFEDEGDPNGLFQLAYAIGLSRFPGLGILALRSVLTMARDDDDDLSFLLSFRLSEIRDQLNLAPEDSSTAILETLQRKTATEAETAAEIAKARREAEAQRARFRDAQQAIKALHRVIKRRESVSSQKAAQPEPGAPDENGVEKELRRKIDLLMEEVKREHSEKNMYRRKYEATAKAMEQWRAQVEAAEPVQADPSADPEDDLLLPESLNGPNLFVSSSFRGIFNSNSPDFRAI
jgi:hypothetical protein